MNHRNQDPASGAIKQVKKAYKKPELRKHGRVSRITTGGSGTLQEMMMMTATMRFP